MLARETIPLRDPSRSSHRCGRPTHSGPALAPDETQSCAPARNARLLSALERVLSIREIRARTSDPEYLARHQLDQATALVLGEIAGEAVDGDVDGQSLRVRLSPERSGDGGQVARAEQHDVRGVLTCDAVGGPHTNRCSHGCGGVST